MQPEQMNKTTVQCTSYCHQLPFLDNVPSPGNVSSEDLVQALACILLTDDGEGERDLEGRDHIKP